MSLILTAVLVISGLIGAVVTFVGVPVLLGMMAWDVFSNREGSSVRVHDAQQRISLERGVARGFVIAGGAFWAIAAFAGASMFQMTGMPAALLGAFIPLVATAATLIVGWYFERMTAVLLAIASMAVVVWGVMAGFEAGVWAIVTFALIGPMATASVLFWLARREQEAFELSLAAKSVPELATVAPTRASRF